MARTKYTEKFCGYCNKATRMEHVGEMEGVKDKSWYRCCRCHHTTLLDSGINSTSSSGEKIDITKATIYQPCQCFKVGESIFHSEWNDVGTVISKMKTSDGGQAILVSFEKQGQRRLIENLKAETAVDVTTI
jgi:hypothetical protein